MSNEQKFKIGMKVRKIDKPFLYGMVTAIKGEVLTILPVGCETIQSAGHVSRFTEYTNDDERFEPYHRVEFKLKHTKTELDRAEEAFNAAQQAFTAFDGERP